MTGLKTGKPEKPYKCLCIVRSILFINGNTMIKFAKYEFYEQGEHIPIPSSFELIAESDQKMIYAKGVYGRSVEWKLDNYLNRYGWVVKKLVRSGTGRYIEA